MDEVVAGVLPDGKENVIRSLKKREKSPCRRRYQRRSGSYQSRYGIAIGAGTDIAIDAADVVLMKSRLTDVPAAIRLSRATLATSTRICSGAFFYNAIGIPLAVGVWIPAVRMAVKPHVRSRSHEPFQLLCSK